MPSRCPNCGAQVSPEPLNPHRPFCSERCRLLDLHAWATDRYRIASTTSANGHIDESGGLDPHSGNENAQN